MTERDEETREPEVPPVAVVPQRKRTPEQRARTLVRAETRPKGGGVVIIGGVAFETFLESSAAGAVDRIVGILADEIQAAEAQARSGGLADAYERAAMLVSVLDVEVGDGAGDPIGEIEKAIRELARTEGAMR